MKYLLIFILLLSGCSLFVSEYKQKMTAVELEPKQKIVLPVLAEKLISIKQTQEDNIIFSFDGLPEYNFKKINDSRYVLELFNISNLIDLTPIKNLNWVKSATLHQPKFPERVTIIIVTDTPITLFAESKDNYIVLSKTATNPPLPALYRVFTDSYQQNQRVLFQLNQPDKLTLTVEDDGVKIQLPIETVLTVQAFQDIKNISGLCSFAKITKNELYYKIKLVCDEGATIYPAYNSDNVDLIITLEAEE